MQTLNSREHHDMHYIIINLKYKIVIIKRMYL